MQALRDMWARFTPTRQTAVLLFFGLSGLYLSLSPASIAGQGYTGEEIASGERMLAVLNACLKGRPIPPMLWSRHGPVPVLLDLPFIKLGKMLVSPDFMLSFQPVLLTAALLTILYLWLRKLCSPGMSLLLTLTGAFGTMLWPYAYISLETNQSFFVFLAGYLALADGKLRSWPRLLLFAATCGLAMTMKSTGIILWPAIAYLLYAQFRDDWRSQGVQLATTILVIVAIWRLSTWGWSFYWAPRGGGASNLSAWVSYSPLHFFTNLIGIFGSPTKGLFVYAPVLLASIYAVPRAFRAHREIVIYALLVTACTLGLLSLLRSSTDEVWGCRYMHLAIAPLILCIGAAWPRFRWRHQGPLVALALVGLVISFLGAFYYYALLDFAMKDADQNTLQWITGDSVWNHVEFNAHLFRVWFHGGTAPIMWTPAHIWIWTPPPDALPWKSIDLRQFCQPQSFMVRFWSIPNSGADAVIFHMYVALLVIGVLLLAWVIVRVARERQQLVDERAPTVADQVASS